MKKTTKKVLATGLVLALGLGVLAGCGNGGDADQEGGDKADLTVIKVGASPTPHAEILEAIKDDLAAEGYDLQVQEFNDYILPNKALSDGDLDANYFQHKPYLDTYNEENNTDLASVAEIHYEPLGLYPGKAAAVADLKEGDQIAVPADTSNEARALNLLQDQGVIKLKDGLGLLATKNDIIDNPLNLEIMEMEAAQIPRALQDMAMGVINGNYALQADLSADENAIATEGSDSFATEFPNVIAVRAGDEERPEIKALVKAMTSETAKKYMEEKYKGAVIPLF